MFRVLFSGVSTCPDSRHLTLIRFPNLQSNGHVFITYGPHLKLMNLLFSDWGSIAFWMLWLGFLALIIYGLFVSCRDNRNSRAPRSSSNTRSASEYWFPGDHPDNQSRPPPPPYSKQTQNAPGWQNWRPGFWTGAALGGLANYMWNRPRTEAPLRPTAYDWESVRPQPSFFGAGSGYRPNPRSDFDRGEGSSNLGPMRRSTGLGGSNVR